MPSTNEIDLTIRHMPTQVYHDLERLAHARGQTVEELILHQAQELASNAPKDSRGLEEILESIRATREEIAKSGPILREGESFKDLGREGLS